MAVIIYLVVISDKIFIFSHNSKTMNFYVFIGFGTGVQKFCIFLLCYGAVVRLSVYRKKWFPCNNFSSSWPIILNLSHKDPWHRIKVCIDLGYCRPTSFQTRGPNMQKQVFLGFFVHGEFMVHLVLISFF
jgi:hypothetical protein